MSKDQIEGERRTLRLAGFAGLAGVVLFIAAGAAGLASEFRGADTIVEQFVAFDDESGEFLLLSIAQGLALILFAAPLAGLFVATRNRSDAIRPGLIGLTVAAPLFFGAALVTNYFTVDSAATAYDDLGAIVTESSPSVEKSLALVSDSSIEAIDVKGGGGGTPAAAGAPFEPDSDADEVAEEVIQAQSAADVTSGLQFAGILGLVFAIVYTSLHAMRAGLLTRFWGTLGMALGVGSMFIGLPAILAFSLAISLMFAGFWPGGRPPAWDAGEAVPWPKPGEEPPPGPGRADLEEEAASPEDFEGTATEVPPERPGRRDNKRKRKRKQR